MLSLSRRLLAVLLSLIWGRIKEYEVTTDRVFTF